MLQNYYYLFFKDFLLFVNIIHSLLSSLNIYNLNFGINMDC